MTEKLLEQITQLFGKDKYDTSLGCDCQDCKNGHKLMAEDILTLIKQAGYVQLTKDEAVVAEKVLLGKALFCEYTPYESLLAKLRERLEVKDA